MVSRFIYPPFPVPDRISDTTDYINEATSGAASPNQRPEFLRVSSCWDVLFQAVAVALQDARELLIARAMPRAGHDVDLNALEPRRARQGRGALEKARRRPKYARRTGSTSCCSWPRTRPRAWRPCANSDGGLLE